MKGDPAEVLALVNRWGQEDDVERIRNTPAWLHGLFAWAFDRHMRGRHNADYEVCRAPLCWLAATVERWLWYRGEWQ